MQNSDTYTVANDGCVKEIRVVVPFSSDPDPRSSADIPQPAEIVITVFPDNGASICLAGFEHLNQMGLTENNLIPSDKTVQTVGGFTMTYRIGCQ